MINYGLLLNLLKIEVHPLFWLLTINSLWEWNVFIKNSKGSTERLGISGGGSGTKAYFLAQNP